MAHTIFVEQPTEVEAVRGLRQIDAIDAERVLAAVRGLKNGTITSQQLTKAVEAGAVRAFIDSAAGRAF